MKTNNKPMTKKSSYAEDSIINLSAEIKTEQHLKYPEPSEINGLVKTIGLAVKKFNIAGDGFLLNAKETEVKDKVKLTYNQNAFHYRNSYRKPYYIDFQQWFFDGAWTGNQRGWVKISFDKNYKPENILLQIRLGGYAQMWGGGNFEIQFEGKTIALPFTAKSNEYQAINATVLINKSKMNSKRISPLGDILIHAPHLGSWKFFEAKYSTLLISKPNP
jgi:hypothetical protein